MKRKDLLKATLSEEKNVQSVIDLTTTKDAKFLKRAKRDIEDKIEDATEQLTVRLSNETPLDKSVIEGLYNNIKELKSSLELYKSFEAEFISE
jgi:hypothetical protein